MTSRGNFLTLNPSLHKASSDDVIISSKIPLNSKIFFSSSILWRGNFPLWTFSLHLFSVYSFSVIFLCHFSERFASKDRGFKAIQSAPYFYRREVRQFFIKMLGILSGEVLFLFASFDNESTTKSWEIGM